MCVYKFFDRAKSQMNTCLEIGHAVWSSQEPYFCKQSKEVYKEAHPENVSKQRENDRRQVNKRKVCGVAECTELDNVYFPFILL